MMCRHMTTDLHDVVGIVVTQKSFLNKATLNSLKQMMVRLTFLLSVTQDFDLIIDDRNQK